MVQGIFLCHVVYYRNIKVNKTQIEVIEWLLPPTSIKGMGSFLSHKGFYRCFIKNFSKIANL